jgi:sigma-B regulation protein RsbU (phosphoserine phosphatase)
MLQASLRTQANTQPSVASILENINTLVYRSTAVNQFATFFLARVEEDTLRLTFSNAGHNFPVVFGKDGTRRMLERGGTVVGILESITFEEEAVTLVPGDRVVLYTDGINEAANEDGELYGEERLYALIASLPPELSAREITERLLEGVREFLDGMDAGDDMTVMVLRVLEPQAGAVDGAAPVKRATAAASAPAGQPA